MNNTILESLRLTLIGDNIKLQEINSVLQELSVQQGFCISLMEIIDEPSIEFPVKQAALIQLKNTIKTKWKKLPISTEEKNLIKNSLIMAVIRCANHYMLIKLYREIVSIVVGYEFESWLPFEQILGHLTKNQNLVPVFQCINAICTNFEFSMADKQKTYFSHFLIAVLPDTLNAVKNNFNNPELIYLALKILYKVVHYELNQEVKILTNNWMELILLIIRAYNEQFQKQIDDFQARNTSEFFYFHSKKWATRILMRYVQKHAKATIFGQVCNENSEYSKYWYENFGIVFIEEIIKQLEIPTIRKVRYFQLKTIQGWISDKPEIMIQYAAHLQYNILLPYLSLTPADEQLAKNDAIEYFRNEEEPNANFTNLKGAALDVWTAYLQLGSKNNREKKEYEPGPMMEGNFKFLLQAFNSDNLVSIEMAMYIFCQIRNTVNKIDAVKELIPKILNQCVIPLLSNRTMLLRARANDMFAEYGKDIEDFSIISKAAEGIYKCLSEDQSPLVRIKAAIAFHPILSQQKAKELVKPILKNILEIYLKLIEIYDIEAIVSALEYVINDFSSEIGPYAVDLFECLSNLFIKMFNKDSENAQKDDSGSEIELAASGCLKTMSQIIEAPLQDRVRLQLEKPVINICAFLFSNESLDYTEDLMYLLNAYIYKIEKLSPEIWFYYQVIIYFIAGIPSELWKLIQSSPMSQTHKNILLNIKNNNNSEYLENSVPVLRNFLSKGKTMIMNQKEEFKHNFLQMYFYLISSVFKYNSKEIDTEIELDSATIMLVYLFETFPPEFTKSAVAGAWNYVKFNLLKAKTCYLRQINLQLIFVLFWKHPNEIYSFMVKEQYEKVAYPTLRKEISRIEEPQERKRLILGICNILLLPQRSDKLNQFLPFLFQNLIKLLKMNSRSRIILAMEEENRKEELMKFEDENSEEEFEQSYEQYDDEEFWDEEFYEKYDSPLEKIDELAYFKSVMSKIQAEDGTFYNALINCVAEEKLMKLNAQMQAIQSLEQKRKKN